MRLLSFCYIHVFFSPVDLSDSFLCVSGGCVNFIVRCKENPVGKQYRSDQTPQNAASELGLHCLHMSSC